MLFTFIGGSGHLRPLFPFARAAQAAGHTVAIAGAGNRYEEIVAAGFTAFRTSEPRPTPTATATEAEAEAEEPLPAPDPLRDERVMREGFAGRGARRHAAAIRELALTWKPDVIVRDEVDFGAAIAAQTLGIACATVMVLLAGGFVRPDVVADPLDELRAEYGLPPDPDLSSLRGELLIMPAPPTLRDPKFPLPEDTFYCRPDHTAPAAESTPSRTRPGIYCTFGTIDTYRELFDKILTAVRDLPVDLVMTVGPRLNPASFGPQPAHVRIASFLPQNQVLPNSDLVIAHGGSGTLIGSLAHGLPSLLLPLGADQPHNTRRCVALGTARDLNPMTFTPQDVTNAITQLTDKSTATPYRTSARQLQSEINALPSPEATIAALEHLT